MKLICDRAAFVEAVQIAAAVVAPRGTVPALLSIKLTAKDNRLHLQAADKDIALDIPAASVDVKAPGEALVPADRLSQIARECAGGTLAFESNKSILTIKADGMRFNVHGYEPKDFPAPPQLTTKPECSVSAGVLRKLIDRTIFATAVENNRYALGGVLMERVGKRLRLVGTDGRRLAVAKGECLTAGDGDSASIVPTKALNLLNRLAVDPEAPIEVARSEGRVVFTIGKGPDAARLVTSLVEGTFPPFDDVIPKDHDRRVTCDVAALTAAVRRSSLLTTEQSKGVKLSFTPTQLTLSSSSPDVGDSEITMPLQGYQGEPIDVGFNPGYITDALRIIDTPEVTIELKANNKPGVLRIGQEFTYVIMPLNV
jgi:DNA polymerase-3 subunit beta